MTWLVDTNVVSEVRKGVRCHPAVAAWWAGVEDRDLFLSALTLGEIRKGIEGVRPRDPAKAAALEAWLAEVAGAFGPRVLGVDAAVAEALGRMSAGRSVPVVDALLAATAGVHGLVLVTRNAADVEGLGVRVLDPFAAVQGDRGGCARGQEDPPGKAPGMDRVEADATTEDGIRRRDGILPRLSMASATSEENCFPPKSTED